MVYIYALCDPKTNDIRYIGKSIRPKERYTNHLNDQSKTHKVNWIKSLKKKGLKPTMIILQKLDDNSDWQTAERDWIKQAKENGWNLVNSTDGGDGVLNLSGEGKERMLKTWKGRKHKPETLLKLSKSSKGRIKSDKSKHLLSEKMVGREIKWKDKLKEAVRKFTDDEIKKIQSEIYNGLKVKDAAIKYNVHRTTISKIKAGTYHTFQQKTRNYIKPRLYHFKTNQQ